MRQLASSRSARRAVRLKPVATGIGLWLPQLSPECIPRRQRLPDSLYWLQGLRWPVAMSSGVEQDQPDGRLSDSSSVAQHSLAEPFLQLFSVQKSGSQHPAAGRPLILRANFD